MTTDDQWLEIIQNITSQAPVDLDPVIFSKRAHDLPGAFPAPFQLEDLPSATLWSRPMDGTSYIGLRVRTAIADVAPIAMRLAAAAIERKVIPIILSTQGRSGFERFGFRCELVYGSNESEFSACEAELARFWNLAIVIDAADVAFLT
jgi:hypothetical protein